MKQTRMVRKRKKKTEQRGKKEEGTTIPHIKASHKVSTRVTALYQLTDRQTSQWNKLVRDPVLVSKLQRWYV